MAREQAKTGRRRLFLTFLAGSAAVSAASPSPSLGKTKKQTPYDERRLLEQNKRIQRENNVPDDFPSFLREGFVFVFDFLSHMSALWLCMYVWNSSSKGVCFRFHCQSSGGRLLCYAWFGSRVVGYRSRRRRLSKGWTTGGYLFTFYIEVSMRQSVLCILLNLGQSNIYCALIYLAIKFDFLITPTENTSVNLVNWWVLHLVSMYDFYFHVGAIYFIFAVVLFSRRMITNSRFSLSSSISVAGDISLHWL